MHLWPSTMIRDSFKLDYLRGMEWNLQRMNSSQKEAASSSSSAANQKLVDTNNSEQLQHSKTNPALMLLSFCLCCGGSCVLDIPFLQFSEKYENLQHATNKKLDMNFSRMDNMKHDVDKLAAVVSSLRKKESLYREAFRRRCHDLWKAETEGDLLGDQVDALLSLLEKIYIILYQHSPALQPYFQVSDILELIKKELGGVYNASKD